MPGTDPREATRIVLGECPDLPHLVELPARGPWAGMTGRALALVDGLGFDLQPAGWRLTDASGLDLRRAESLLREDLDTIEELAARPLARVKVQVTGPWTLAATVELPRGGAVVGDHGARRDLAQALAEGVREHVAEVRRRLDPGELVVQLDEPALPAVIGAKIPTASGFGRHRAVPSADAAQALSLAAEAATEAGAERVVVHCCADTVPFDVLAQTPVSAVAFDIAHVDADAAYEAVGGWLDSGRDVWLGVVPTLEPDGPAPTAEGLAADVLAWWRRVGFAEAESAPSAVLTPACGLAGASPAWARTALGLGRRAAETLSAEQGRMA